MYRMPVVGWNFICLLSCVEFLSHSHVLGFLVTQTLVSTDKPLTELIDKDCNKNIFPLLCYFLEIIIYFSVFSVLPHPKVETVKAFQLGLVPTGVRISDLVTLSGKPSTL